MQSLNIRTKPPSIANECLKTEYFGSKHLKHFFGSNSWTFSQLLHREESALLTKRVQKWSTKESYLSLKEVVVLIMVVNDSAERSLGLATDYHIDRITRSEEQKFHLYQVVT